MESVADNTANAAENFDDKVIKVEIGSNEAKRGRKEGEEKLLEARELLEKTLDLLRLKGYVDVVFNPNNEQTIITIYVNDAKVSSASLDNLKRMGEIFSFVEAFAEGYKKEQSDRVQKIEDPYYEAVEVAKGLEGTILLVNLPIERAAKEDQGYVKNCYEKSFEGMVDHVIIYYTDTNRPLFSVAFNDKGYGGFH